LTSIGHSIGRALRKAAALVGDLLPAPPSSEAPPPDIDGRRPMSADATEAELKAQVRDGRGAGSNQ